MRLREIGRTTFEKENKNFNFRHVLRSHYSSSGGPHFWSSGIRAQVNEIMKSIN